MPLQKFFYTRLVYNAITIDFPALNTENVPNPTNLLTVDEIPIRGQNVAVGGPQETLFERMEVRLTLGFMHLDNATLAALRTYWTTWASLGKQAAITLDRLATCAGQYEYDQFNAYFTKAELLNNPFTPRKSVAQRPLYQVQLAFRQGA